MRGSRERRECRARRLATFAIVTALLPERQPLQRAFVQTHAERAPKVAPGILYQRSRGRGPGPILPPPRFNFLSRVHSGAAASVQGASVGAGGGDDGDARRAVTLEEWGVHCSVEYTAVYSSSPFPRLTPRSRSLLERQQHARRRIRKPDQPVVIRWQHCLLEIDGCAGAGVGRAD